MVNNNSCFRWTRYWIPLGETIYLDEYGFPHDPEGEFKQYYSFGLSTLEQLENQPVLFLLGEPGMGKSNVLKEERKRLEQQNFAKVILIELRDMDNSGWLKDIVFQNSGISEWKHPDSQTILYLLLDGLDESGIGPDRTLGNLLRSIKDEGWPLEKLRLRLTCRTANWPFEVLNSNNIKELWPDNASEISCFQEIVPLTKRDVLEAINSIQGVDSQAFLAEVERLDASSMASKPLTLKMLIHEFNNNGALPESRKVLFERGCLKLCEETTEFKTLKRSLSDRKLFVTAGRIATVTLLSSKNEIFRRPQGTDKVSFEDLSWGHEIIDDQKFPVDSNAIRETLRTGLFSARGENALGWAHQSYGEFLAAWYLKKRDIPVRQILNLIMHPEGDAVVPQLQEMASWLVSMNPELFPEILERDPLVLLRNDSLSAEQKSKLADALLKSVNWGSLPFQTAILIRPYLRNLQHDSLDNKLRPYLTAESSISSQRLFALQIASECSLPNLKENISALLLDTKESSEIRVKAALALKKIGVDENIEVFRDLLFDFSRGEQSDPDHRLRGLILSFLWPTHLTSEELFQSLVPLEAKVYGFYRRFLSSQILLDSFWEKKDILLGLQWVLQEEIWHGSTDPIFFAFNILMDTLLVRAFAFIDDELFLDIYLSAFQMRHNKEAYLIFDDKLVEEFKTIYRTADEQIKKQFTQAVVKTINGKAYKDFWVYFLCYVVDQKDLHWVLNQTKACYQDTPESPEKKEEMKRWCELSNLALNLLDKEHIGTILAYCQDIPPLADYFKDLVEMSNTKTAEQIVHELEEKRGKQLAIQRNRQTQLINPSPSERVQDCLSQIEEGHPECWPKLLLNMSLTEYGVVQWPGSDDVTTFPEWEKASDDTKNRIIDAAVDSLRGAEIPNRNLGSDSTNNYELSILLGLLLLCKESPEKFADLPLDTWLKVIPFILDLWSFLPGDSHREGTELIFSTAFNKARETYLASLKTLFLNNDNKYFYQKIEPCISPCWCNEISDLLAEIIGEPDLSIGSHSAILSLLIEHNDERGIAEAERLFENKPETDSEEKRVVETIRVLLRYPDQKNWEIFWSFIDRFPDIGSQYFQSDNEDYSSGDFLKDERRTETELADFFIWMCRQFPHQKDLANPTKDQSSSGNSFSSTVTRSRALEALVNYGTEKSVHEIERIQRDLPHLEFLSSSLEKAKENTRKATWHPLAIQQIRKFLEDSDNRIVRSGSQFVDVIIESLDRMYNELQGETPSAILFWNECKDKSKSFFEPKDESRFSDAVKRHLEKDLKKRGIILDREVEIKGTTAPGTGQRLDIYARAISPGQSLQPDCTETFDVKIEIKGSWNKEVEMAMETQLVNRYLKTNNSHHGIYLVGWFDCERKRFRNWENKKPRCWETIDEARSALKEQAKSLSKDGVEVKSYVMDFRFLG